MTLKSAQRADMNEFAKRVRSMLFREDRDAKTYNTWQSKVDFLRSPEGGGFTKNEAIVQAAKDYPCVHRLFREYDLSVFDPRPDSHPAISWKTAVGPAEETAAGIICEGKELAYRDALDWAIEAAGEYYRTKTAPKVCPSNKAYYLYQQAINDPKDFLGKVGQVESKNLGDDPELKDMRKAGKRATKEIEAMLQEILGDSDE